jgi:hypothetical protein
MIRCMNAGIKFCACIEDVFKSDTNVIKAKVKVDFFIIKFYVAKCNFELLYHIIYSCILWF